MRIVSQLFDLLFPPRETDKLVRETSQLPFVPQIVDGTICLTRFKNPTVKAAITENKFFKNTFATQLLADLLQTWLDEQTGNIILTPIPLGKKRQRSRGYNQVSEVLKLCMDTRIHIEEGILTRTKETKAQTSLRRDERIKNMQQVFSVRKSKLPEDCLIVLVDDVLTTGATMTAARETLQQDLHSSSLLITVTLAH